MREGHVISAQGVSSDPGKVEVVASWKPLTTVMELRSFLGFASYYCHFHLLVAELERSKSKQSEKWLTEYQQSFGALKSKLTTAPLLTYADFSLHFILEVDVSHGGLGAVLAQEQEGKLWPIAFASQSLWPTELNPGNYCSMKLPFLALKWAMLEKFWEYLLGHKCIVFTYNNPLSQFYIAKA